MTPSEARDFAHGWAAAWNTRDLEAILAHYAPEVEFTSPIARQVTGDGRVVGLSALRNYWERGLSLNPDLHFEVTEALVGDGCVTVLYRNHRTQTVAETFYFGPDGAVVRASACYGEPS
jgi:predicted ester cyclase